MRAKRWIMGAVGCASMAITALLFGAIFPSDKGEWPKDWPEELEELREHATTLAVATGVQENVYTIYFDERARLNARPRWAVRLLALQVARMVDRGDRSRRTRAAASPT